MPDLLVRDVKPETVAYLKAEAARKRTPLQPEARRVLEAVEEQHRRLEEFRADADAFREATRGREHTDSAELRHVGRPD